jgi:hypothetical protein
MRKLFRLAVPVLAAAAIALGSGSTALAAASPTILSLDANWCFEDGVMRYCFDVDGQVHFLDNKAGSSVTVNEITRTTYYQNGEYAGESMSVQMFRGVFQNDGTNVLQSLIHTRSTAFGEDCVYRMVLRISDYEVVVDHVESTCGA